MLITLILAALLIALWASHNRLKRHVEILEARLDAQHGSAAILERRAIPTAPVVPVPAPSPAAVVASSAPVRAASVAAVIPSPSPRPSAPPTTPIAAPVPARPVVASPAVAAPLPPGPEPATPTAASTDGWEVVVGTSWLNKLGVLVFVIGLALLVGYSMTQLGPAGRVAIGFAISATMLGTGVVLERRAEYRSYAYGLVAGGWAGAYFTAYAMHALPAARIVTSALVGTSCLAAIATGMIAHSLRYGSQTVTALAYVVAYVTLALSPLSGFSLVASVPLAISLLVVSQRLGWSEISSLGLISTYGIFVLRGQLFVAAAADGGGLMPYLVLAAYWLTFEAADIITLRTRPTGATAPLFALNAIGFVGAALIETPPSETRALSLLLASTASAYLASAIVRSAVPGRSIGAPAEAGPARFTTTHGALAIAAALVAWSIDLRFSGPRETLALLLEAELLVAAGIVLKDSLLRRMGAIAAVFATWQGWMMMWPRPDDLVFGVSAGTPVLALTALAWYANREWMRARQISPGALEHAYTWTATLLVAGLLILEVEPLRVGLATFVFAAVLLEVGLRRAKEYRTQAYLVGMFATWAVVLPFVLAPAVPADIWIVMPAAIAITGLAALRLAHAAALAGAAGDLRLGAAITFSIAAGLLVAFQWRVVPVDLIAPVWALTAVALLAGGVLRRVALFRWHGYVLALLAAWRSVDTLAAGPSVPAWQVTIVIAALYSAAIVSRRFTRSISVDARGSEERVHAVLAIAGTWVLAGYQWRVVAPIHIGGLWTLTGFTLLVAGIRTRLANLRWQGYVLLLAGSTVSLRPVLESGAAPRALLIWMAIDILALYVASLISRSVIRPEDPKTEIESACRVALSLAGTCIMAAVIFEEVPRTMITLSWGLGGLLLLLGGFPARERVLRLSGLALLFLCLIKLFFNDLGQLEAWPRIISFVVLGLVLLGVSWIYTKLREGRRAD
ncbi:MAG TPA: DUF2339 domain-containing protein [Vicinamibacterales bacterium]|nr:DUF2339 domain-containing protein [Vicinamibacterales bacterium]